MGITIQRGRLEEVLQRAVIAAESDSPVPGIWIDRIERIENCPSRTYVAALGTALLAKATDERIDALTIKSKAGPNAYSMRGVVKVLAEKAAIYGYHLGATGPEPLNNQPWFSAERVDRMANVHANDAPFHRDIVRYLTELNSLDGDHAFAALVAYLRKRLAVGEAERARMASLRASASNDLASLIDVVTLFIRNDPEGGRRGQSLVAAVLECAHPEVFLAPINSPVGLDVELRDDGEGLLGIEVKQKPVTEATALHLAEEARRVGVDKALLVALAPDQRALDRERVRTEALALHSVLVAIWESVGELITEVALQASCTAVEFAERLPGVYLQRMQSHGVSQSGLDYWVDLTRSL